MLSSGCKLNPSNEMSASGQPDRLRFGAFELDLDAGELLRDGRPVKIQPQPLKVLMVLAARPGKIVSRDELRARIWDRATFVEFDQGLNYCIRQIRVALEDDASDPRYLETVKKRGYRFIAPLVQERVAADTSPAGQPADEPDGRRRSRPGSYAARLTAAAIVVAAVAGGWLFSRSTHARHTPQNTTAVQQITDFADSAVAPAVSPDGRMIAFIRGNNDFLTPDQIYVKMLPDGEAKQLTDDRRLKYAPSFSPDGSEVAYTVMENSGWSTYTVSVLGGEPHLLLTNAAGLTWLDRHQLLFSETRNGQHMGIVAGPESRAGLRELYFPAHERAMAHYSYPSPDRASALVVEMNQDGLWVPCRLIALDGRTKSAPVGPPGPCRAAGWSPDGRWMYFAAAVNGQGHLWRQRARDGVPEQITSGATEESGVAVDPDGQTLMTSIGVRQSTLWIHTGGSERQLSSEGQIVGCAFSEDGRFIYYLRRLESEGQGRELRRMSVSDGKSEVLLPGVSVLEFDVSRDDKDVVFTTSSREHSTQLWIAPTDRGSPPKPIGATGERSPFFGPAGEVLFRFIEGRFNYLGRMNRDGTARAKVVPYPISFIQSVSPGRNWVMAVAPLLDNSTVAPMAIPVRGGNPIRICEIYCQMAWATSGRFLFASVEEPSRSSPGRTLAIPVGPGEMLPALPPKGIHPLADASVVSGARSVGRAGFAPGADADTFAYVQDSVHRNLFRVTLPPG